MSENGEIYSAGKNFTLPPALTVWTNSTSECNGNDILRPRGMFKAKTGGLMTRLDVHNVKITLEPGHQV